jgi:hypothetical protein
MANEDLADHGRLGVAGGRDHQHVARFHQVERMEDGAEIGRLAPGGQGAAEQAGLPAWREERPDRRVDLANIPTEIDGDGDRHRAPGLDLGWREIGERSAMDRDGHGRQSFCDMARSAGARRRTSWASRLGRSRAQFPRQLLGLPGPCASPGQAPSRRASMPAIAVIAVMPDVAGTSRPARSSAPPGGSALARAFWA